MGCALSGLRNEHFSGPLAVLLVLPEFTLAKGIGPDADTFRQLEALQKIITSSRAPGSRIVQVAPQPRIRMNLASFGTITCGA